MLRFKYCECGCKGMTSLPIGRSEFWYFDDLFGNVTLHRGHGKLAPFLGNFGTALSAMRFAHSMAQSELRRERNYLLLLEKQLNDKAW